MITLVGLGSTGTKIVQKLSVHSQYKTVTIDSGKEIKEYNSPEEYEKKCPSFKKLFKQVTEEVYLFLSASGNISGACLRILEQLKGKNINVVCISSDPVSLSSVGNLQQNLVSGVLQEYARSGLIQNLYLIDNAKIEDMIEDVSLEDYWDQINETICYVFHTYMYFCNTKPVMSLGHLEQELANIHTFCILKNNEDKKNFYDIKYVTNELYFFSYNKKTDKNLLKKVKNFIQENSKNKKIGAYIYETNEENLVTYARISTQITQTKKSDFGLLDKQSDL
jgi:hypothetical protein